MHTDFAVARTAIEQGFDPHYLGTDLTVSNRYITVDMPTTISKFVALGLSLEDALAKSTSAPAAKLGRGGDFGLIRYSSSGVPDQRFGSNGQFKADLAGDSDAWPRGAR